MQMHAGFPSLLSDIFVSLFSEPSGEENISNPSENISHMVLSCVITITIACLRVYKSFHRFSLDFTSLHFMAAFVEISGAPLVNLKCKCTN